MKFERGDRTIFRFGVFELNVEERELRKHGSRVKLQHQPFVVLTRLLGSPNSLVSRAELRDELWPEDTFVDFDHSLNEAVNKLRVALGDSATNPRFVETVPRHGYRFIAPVERISQSAPVALPPRRRWVPVGLAVAALSLALGWSYWRRTPPPVRSIAVLPLDNLSRDETEDYFADGMTDELIARLSKIEGLRVMSRTSVLRYKHTEKSAREIGRELGVESLIDGTVRLSGDRVRITVHLDDAATDRTLWSEAYEGEARSVLEIQTEVARAIAREVDVKLTARDEARLAKRRSVSVEAYEAYLKGRYHWNRRTEVGFLKGIEYFSEALSYEPAYAEAFAGLADTYGLLAVYNIQRHRTAMPRAKEAALRALELDPDLAAARASLGNVLFLYDWDFEAAETEMKRAVDSNPGYATTYQWYGVFLISMNRTEEALQNLRRALELDPLSLSVGETAGWALYCARRYPEAIEQFQKTLELDPRFGHALRYLGLTYLHLGRYAEGLEALEQAQTVFSEEVEIQADLALAYTLSGKREEGEALLQKILSIAEERYVSPYLIGYFHAGLGNNEQALDWLSKALEERVANLVFLAVDPFFDPLRAHPRFRTLLRQLGLEGSGVAGGP